MSIVFDASSRWAPRRKGMRIMRIDIHSLAEGVNEFRLDEPADELVLPTDETTFPEPISVVGTLTKTGNNLVLHATMSTNVRLECGRCLASHLERITAEFEVLYQWTDRGVPVKFIREEADEVETIDYDAQQIEIGWRVEEAIHLALPLKPLCREDCRGLCPICGADLNETTCRCRRDVEDPRWLALKAMFK